MHEHEREHSKESQAAVMDGDSTAMKQETLSLTEHHDKAAHHQHSCSGIHDHDHDDGDNDGENEGSGDDATTGSDASKPKRWHGASCHQCKTAKDPSLLLFCSSVAEKGVRKRRCRKKYCESCLRRSYSASASLPNSETSQWICPSCSGFCVCAACSRSIVDASREGIIGGLQSLSSLSPTILSLLGVDTNKLVQLQTLITSPALNSAIGGSFEPNHSALLNNLISQQQSQSLVMNDAAAAMITNNGYPFPTAAAAAAATAIPAIPTPANGHYYPPMAHATNSGSMCDGGNDYHHHQHPNAVYSAPTMADLSPSLVNQMRPLAITEFDLAATTPTNANVSVSNAVSPCSITTTCSSKSSSVSDRSPALKPVTHPGPPSYSKFMPSSPLVSNANPIEPATQRFLMERSLVFNAVNNGNYYSEVPQWSQSVDNTPVSGYGGSKARAMVQSHSFSHSLNYDGSASMPMPVRHLIDHEHHHYHDLPYSHMHAHTHSHTVASTRAMHWPGSYGNVGDASGVAVPMVETRKRSHSACVGPLTPSPPSSSRQRYSPLTQYPLPVVGSGRRNSNGSIAGGAGGDESRDWDHHTGVISGANERRFGHHTSAGNSPTMLTEVELLRRMNETNNLRRASKASAVANGNGASENGNHSVSDGFYPAAAGLSNSRSRSPAHGYGQ